MMKSLKTLSRHPAAFRQIRALCVLLVAVALAATGRNPGAVSALSVTSESTVVLQTTGAPFLQGAFNAVSNELGDQTNPHVECDLASYTYDDFQGQSTIHYQNLSTGADNIIPGNRVDLLSNVSGSRVAFTEVDFPGDTIVVFDTLTQTRTVVASFGRSNPSIGGNLVAFEDRNGFTNFECEVGTYDLSTGTLSRLTNDALLNRRIEVSPNGDALVWEKCQLNGLGCDIYSAVRTSPGVFTTRALTVGGGEDFLPHTNGEIAVYVSNRSGENDIYYQPLTGGTEVHLSIPGDQRDPTISGNLICFESSGQSGYDIFVYDIRSSRLFQVTNTPGDERLSEIDVCNGVGRIVYSIVGDGAYDVYSFTFQVPSATEGQINDLMALVRSFNLTPGTTNSLITKLQTAVAAIDTSDTATACSSLTGFVNECQAQSGKKLTPEQSNQLISSANRIRMDLGCD